MAIVLLASGLVIGLWVVPSELPPIVAAAAILGRALVAVGVLAFGLALLGMAERLWVREDREKRS